MYLDSQDVLHWPVYQLGRMDKRRLMEAELRRLTRYHIDHCEPYARILAARGIEPDQCNALELIPFIPVRLFKHVELRSISSNQVFKTLYSSGTSGQAPSRIILDKPTAQLQTAALVKIVQEFLGKNRLPMLIIDHAAVIADRRGFSARGAGILGLSNFGRAHAYALRDDMSLNLEVVDSFADQHCGVPKLLFGFTFMVWQHFVTELERQGRTVDLGGAILIHSGGWKKLAALAVDNESFKRRVRQIAGLQRIHNFYGMVEQVGSIFFECEQGRLHAPSFAEIIIREPGTWKPLPIGSPGIVQVLSCLPHSYPGHSLLTEDLATVLGEDNCPCGRLGKHFLVHGRIPQAEVRGCSDSQPTL